MRVALARRLSGPTILPRLMRAVVEQARVTHHDPRRAAGAVAIAAASMLACRIDRLDLTQVCTELALALRVRWITGMAAAIEKVERLVAMDPKQATALVHRERPDAESSHKWRGVSSEVTGSVCWSLYAFSGPPTTTGKRSVPRSALAATPIPPLRWQAESSVRGWD